jgi:hypothetical protein
MRFFFIFYFFFRIASLQAIPTDRGYHNAYTYYHLHKVFDTKPSLFFAVLTPPPSLQDRWPCHLHSLSVVSMFRCGFASTACVAYFIGFHGLQELAQRESSTMFSSIAKYCCQLGVQILLLGGEEDAIR